MATIIDQLRRDHEDVRLLLDRLQSGLSAVERQDLTGQIIKQLRRHTHAEQDVVVPAVGELSGEDRGLVEASGAQHGTIEQLLRRLEGFDVGRSDFESSLVELATSMDEHVEAYEDRVLPRLEASLDADRQDELGSEFVEAKDGADLLTQPGPDPERTTFSES
ncbi:MAG TPA: hemerythrin domain-containing protein [Nitriliruptorales bacterium]|nr:hemerythrin domain-containing protein [Nitriliruptorales bacterium]